MAADIHHQAELMLPPASTTLFQTPCCSDSGLSSGSDSGSSRGVEEVEENTTESTRQMDQNQRYFQNGSTKRLHRDLLSWSSAAERGRIHEVPNDMLCMLEKMNLAQKMHASAMFSSDYFHQLGRVTSDDELRAVKAQQLMRHSGSTLRKRPAKNTCRSGVLPPLQQSSYIGGSEMRVVFLGGLGSGDRIGGTGVFLPRGTGNSNSNSTESRQKPRCSTVLVPTRVAQALMLHFEKMGGPSQGGFPPQHDGRNGLFINQKNQSLAAQNNLDYNDEGLHLPEEWLY